MMKAGVWGYARNLKKGKRQVRDRKKV